MQMEWRALACHSERQRRISRAGLRDSSLTLRMTSEGYAVTQKGGAYPVTGNTLLRMTIEGYRRETRRNGEILRGVYPERSEWAQDDTGNRFGSPHLG